MNNAGAPGDRPAQSRARRRVYNILRIAVCVAALWFVFRGVRWNDRVVLAENGRELVGTVQGHRDGIVIVLPDGRERPLPRRAIAHDESGEPRISYGLASTWRSSGKGLLLLAVLVHLPVGILQGVRLRWLLGVQRITLSLWECVKLSFAGNFLNFAAPLGSNAGDVFKAYFVTTHTRRKTEAATTIVLDRMIGLGTLLTCVGIIVLAAPGSSRLALFRPYILTVLGIGVIGTTVYFSPALRRLMRRLPLGRLSEAVILQQLRRIDRTAHTLARHGGILAGAVAVTVALQVLAIGAYCLVAAAVQLDTHAGNVLEHYAYFYTGAVIAALPGPPQGLGTVELAYRFFFAPFGSPAQIVSMALLIRMIVLVAALPGLLVTLTGAYRPRKALTTFAHSAEPACPKTQSPRNLVIS